MPRPWRRRAVAVGETLLAVARAIGMEGCLREIEIRRVWLRAVGRSVAERARPAGLQGSTLLVHVPDSAWLHRLSMVRQDIIRNVNDHLGAPTVKAVRLRIGPVDDPAGGTTGRADAPVDRRRTNQPSAPSLQAAGPEDPAIGRALASVKDLPFGEVVQRILQRQAALGRRR